MSQDHETNQTSSKSDRHAPAEARPTPKWALVLPVFNLVSLLVALGLISYLLYDQAKETKANQPAREEAKQAKKMDDELKPEVDRLKDQVKGLGLTVEKNAEKPDYGPKLKAMEDRMAQLVESVANLSDRSEAMKKQVGSPANSESQDTSQKIAEMGKRLDEMSTTLATFKADARPRNAPAPDSREMDQAVSLFQQARWAEAKDAFNQVRTVSPEDARVWYYSALSSGMATKDWKGESERLAIEGVAREKAGKPDKAQIDAAFAELTKATGRDWLAFFRNQVLENTARR